MNTNGFFSSFQYPEKPRSTPTLSTLTLRFWGRAWTNSECIDCPSLAVMIGIVWFASSLDVVFLEKVVVDKWSHILGLKKGLLLFPSATPKTQFILCSNCYIIDRNVIIVVCDYVIWISVEPSSLNRTLCSPINRLYVSPTSLYPNPCGSVPRSVFS